jgi:ClpP class serine protease
LSHRAHLTSNFSCLRRVLCELNRESEDGIAAHLATLGIAQDIADRGGRKDEVEALLRAAREFDNPDQVELIRNSATGGDKIRRLI